MKGNVQPGKSFLLVKTMILHLMNALIFINKMASLSIIVRFQG